MLRFADEASGGTANPPADAPDTSNEGAGEGTIPEEVAAVLKNSGIHLPTETVPEATDEEEGEDPDSATAPTAGDAAEEDAAGEGTDSEEVANEEPIEPETPEAPATDTADDKYSFQVEDAEGKTFKITADAKMEDILAEFQPKNNGQVIDILDQLREIKEQKRFDAAEAETEAAKVQQQKQVDDIRKGWNNEIKDLIARERLTEGDEGEARVSQVYQFMDEENDKRIKDGRSTLNSFEDALDKLENQEARTAKIEQDKKDKADARKNGGLVGGSSAPATSGPPAYKAGTARNANEAIRALGLL